MARIPQREGVARCLERKERKKTPVEEIGFFLERSLKKDGKKMEKGLKEGLK